MTPSRIWVSADVVAAVHDRQISEHGGGAGTRDAGLLASALARPENLAAYGEPDAADLAAAYAFWIARNHAFIDGNKRTAWVAARLFLALNRVSLRFAPADAITTVEDLAAGIVDKASLAAWCRARSIAEPDR